MTFSTFTRTESGNQIFFKNSTPIEYVESIKYYKSNESGSFTKKEFRWSFNGDYWASWETLNQGNFSAINVRGNKYLYLEIRYTTSNSAANVTSFTVDYLANAHPGDPCPPIDTTITTPTPVPAQGGSVVCDTGYRTVVNADKLCGQTCDYYLWRPNHKGTQPISSITDLQTTLNSLAGSIQNSITGGDNVSGNGVGVFYDKVGRDLLFKRIDVSGGGVEITESDDGIIYLSVDASFSYDDASINELFTYYYNLSNQLNDLSIYIDSKFVSVDASIIRIDGSINDLYSKLGSDSSIYNVENISDGPGLVFKQISSGTVELRTIEGAGIIDVSTIGDKIIITADTSAFTADVSVKDLENVGSGAAVLKSLDASGIGQFRTLVGGGDVSVYEQGDEITIFINADVSVSPDPWTDPDPVSADVGGISGGDYVTIGSSPKDVLENILYEYFPPNVTLQIDPSPGPTSSTGYYEKWVPSPLAQGINFTYSFNNNNFKKLRIEDVSVYENSSLFSLDEWGGSQSGSITYYRPSPPIGSASVDLYYTLIMGNTVDGIGMESYDVSTSLNWVDPYFYGTVNDSVTYANISNADILGLSGKVILPEQSNEINFDVSANFSKIKFVYAYPASYSDLKSIFDVKNDFNVTTSFDSSIINVKMSGMSGPGPYIPYKVYIKSHWISFTPDVSIFKLNFNI